MKKPGRVILLAIAGLTVITVIAAVIMLSAVSGDNLLFMNSTFGSIYAASYRWVCLAGGLLVVFWILLGVKNRAAIGGKLSFKHKNTAEAKAIVETPVKAPFEAPVNVPVEAPVKPPVTATTEIKKNMFCANCGKQRPRDKSFCPFCGEPAKNNK